MYITFNQFQNILYEGGNAFDNLYYFGSTDKPIIEEKVESFLKSCNIPPEKYKICGSFPTKESDIGDIDVIIQNDKFTFSELEDTYNNLDILESQVPTNYTTKISKTLGVVSVLFDIEKGKQIQIDMIPVESLKWGAWSYWSPSKKASEYKGLYRNALLEAIAKTLHFEVEKYTKDESTEYFSTDDVKSYYRFRYLRNAGLWKVKEVNKGKTIFNYEKIRDTYTKVTNEPNKVISILLGSTLEAKNFLTFESVLNYISNPNWVFYPILSKILENFKIIIVDRQKNAMPKEVRELMKFLHLKVSPGESNE